MGLRRSRGSRRSASARLCRARDTFGARLPRERDAGQIAMEVGQGPRPEPLEVGGSRGKRPLDHPKRLLPHRLDVRGQRVRRLPVEDLVARHDRERPALRRAQEILPVLGPLQPGRIVYAVASQVQPVSRRHRHQRVRAGAIVDLLELLHDIGILGAREQAIGCCRWRPRWMSPLLQGPGVEGAHRLRERRARVFEGGRIRIRRQIASCSALYAISDSGVYRCSLPIGVPVRRAAEASAIEHPREGDQSCHQAPPMAARKGHSRELSS
jgi:hypothetical protein